MPKKERFEWVDVAKGIGIIIVVAVGHSLRLEMREVSPFCQWVYDAFSMFTLVMFFALSGFTYRMGRTVEFGRFLQKKVQTLLFPFFAYALFVYAVYAVAMCFPPTAGMLGGEGLIGIGEYLRLTVVEESPYAAHLWFIWVLFWVSLIVYLSDRLSERIGLPKQWVLWVVAIALQLIDTFCQINSGSAHRVLTNVVGYAFGAELAVRPALVRKGNMLSAIVVVVLSGAAVAFGFPVLGRSMEPWYLDILRQVVWYVVRLALIWGIFRIAEQLKHVKWLSYFGRNSIFIYLLHQPFCCGFVGSLLYNKLRLSIPLAWAGSFLMGLLLPLLAMNIWKWFITRFLRKAR